MSDVTPAVVSPVEALAAEAEAVQPETLKVRDREFRLVDEVPAMTMLRLSSASDPKTPVAAQMSAILAFLQKVVHIDDRDDFLNFLDDAVDPVIDFEELNGVLTNATEIIGGRPTAP